MTGETANTAQAQCLICTADSDFYCFKPPAKYFKCPQCATIFQHPLPSAQEMVSYADQEYSDGLYGEYVQARDLKFLTFRRRMRDIRRRTEGKLLVDVGCSCGYFIDVALENGFDAYGVEFSSVAIAAASEQTRRRITHGDIHQLTTHSKTYDVVTAFDVLEHTLAPVQFLTELRRLLKSGGLLVITTPDTKHYLRSLMGKRWPMLQPLQHTCLFSPASLRRALETAGYTDIEIMPARKVLTPEYLAGQIKGYNPLIASFYNVLSKVLPEKLRNMPISVNISEIMAFARSRD